MPSKLQLSTLEGSDKFTVEKEKPVDPVLAAESAGDGWPTQANEIVDL